MESVVYFSYFSLCTVKEILFYLHTLLPELQQLSFNTFTTSFFLRDKIKQTNCHAHTLGFPSLMVQKPFTHLLTIPFRL